ncbi:MAG: phosphate signaling complex protein PhoU [Chloroflexota bacterium]|nr:phosphate signaling complex protein PhoU [Chloroflexota bacterium]
MPREMFVREVRELQDEMLALGSMAEKAIARAVEALTTRHVMTARQVIGDDDLLDEKRTEIERQALLLIATQQPVASDLRTIAAVMTVATELERIGDYAEGIAKICIDIAGEPALPPITIIPRMADRARDMLDRSLEAFIGRDVEAAKRIWNEDDQIDELYDQVYHELLAFMISDPATINRATRLLWASHNLERIADRVTNICESTVFMVLGQIDVIKTPEHAR